MRSCRAELLDRTLIVNRAQLLYALRRDFVEWDPLDETPAVVSDAQLEGVEAAVWCETVGGLEDLVFLLLPRLADVGEKGWAASGSTGWDDYADRLGGQPAAWDRRGWTWFRSSLVEWKRTGKTLGSVQLLKTSAT